MVAALALGDPRVHPSKSVHHREANINAQCVGLNSGLINSIFISSGFVSLIVMVNQSIQATSSTNYKTLSKEAKSHTDYCAIKAINKDELAKCWKRLSPSDHGLNPFERMQKRQPSEQLRQAMSFADPSENSSSAISQLKMVHRVALLSK